MLLVQVLGFIFMVAGTNGAFAPQPVPPTTTDFAGFYAAGLLADQGRPGAAYDPVVHRKAEEQVVAPGVEEKRFLNPPIFLLICAPLAHLPYRLAFVLFEAVTFATWLAITTRVAGGGAPAAMALAAVPSVWWVLGWGQNSFVSASLMAAGTLLLRRRPLLAGLAFGSLCFKPHFGVLIPVALLAGRYWRAILGAALAVAFWSAVSIACFGLDSWRGFVEMALHARAAIETGIQLAGHVDPGGALRLLGLSAMASWACQAIATLAAACAVAWLWARAPAGSSGSSEAAGTGSPPAGRDGRYEAACAGLVAGTLTAMPFVLFYDLLMAALAAAWLALAGRRLGWLNGDMAVVAAVMLIDLVAFPTASELHLAIGVAIGPLLLWRALRRSVTTPAGVAI